jgi:hypothetical protein
MTDRYIQWKTNASFLVDFWRRQPTAGRVVIIEAPSMFQARMTAVARRFAAGVPFGGFHELSTHMMTSIPPTLIGKTMSSGEAAHVGRGPRQAREG